MSTICLDPGHGGYDPGACGNSLQEKDITLNIVLKLKPLLEYNGFKVILTRDGDYAPKHLENQLNNELQARCDIANNANVDLFLSIHVNSGGGHGQEILVQGFGGNAEIFANKMLPYLINATSFYNRGVKQQNVMVLRNTSMPAILTENGFIDSVDDTNKLKDSNIIDKIVLAHAKGICDYFGITYQEDNKGDDFSMDVCVLYFTPADYSNALIISNLNGGCATYCRNGNNASVHPNIAKAKKVYVIGGGRIDHPNQVYLSGNTAGDTLILIANYLRGN